MMPYFYDPTFVIASMDNQIGCTHYVEMFDSYV